LRLVLEARGIAFAYGGRAVLDGVDLRAAAGALVGVVGPNGAGKSTLLHCLYGGLRPARGAVAVGGDDVLALPPRAVARRIAVVPQAFAPGFPFTVREIVAMGRYAHGRSAEGERAVARALARTGLAGLAR